MPESLFQFPELQQDPHIVHFFTQKPYNFHPDLSTPRLAQQLNKIFTQIHYTPASCYQCNQSHSANIQIITKKNQRTINLADIDGLITNLPGVALTTYVADCQAIFLYDPIAKAIANVHSGWRGTLQKIIQSAITKMITEFHCQPANIQAYICPSLGSYCFEIGSEVEQKFAAEFNNLAQYLHPSSTDPKQKFYLNAVQLNLDLLKSLGLTEQNLIASSLCTKCQHRLYHSHRATAGKTSGRNLALICLKD